MWKSSGKDKDKTVVDGQPMRIVDNRNGTGDVPSTGNFIARITNDAREDEMEENLQEVSQVLGNLKNMAIDMGQEIGVQNQQLDKINEKANLNRARIQGANERTQKLLKY